MTSCMAWRSTGKDIDLVIQLSQVRLPASPAFPLSCNNSVTMQYSLGYWPKSSDTVQWDSYHGPGRNEAPTGL